MLLKCGRGRLWLRRPAYGMPWWLYRRIDSETGQASLSVAFGIAVLDAYIIEDGR